MTIRLYYNEGANKKKSPFITDVCLAAGCAMRHPAPLMLGLSDGLGPPPLALVQGGSLRTWSYRDAAVARVQVLLTSDGLPLDADLELWHGPTNAPCKVGLPILDTPLHCPWHTRRQRHTRCTPPPRRVPCHRRAPSHKRTTPSPKSPGSFTGARVCRGRAAPPLPRDDRDAARPQLARRPQPRADGVRVSRADTLHSPCPSPPSAATPLPLRLQVPLLRLRRRRRLRAALLRLHLLRRERAGRRCPHLLSRGLLLITPGTPGAPVSFQYVDLGLVHH